MRRPLGWGLCCAVAVIGLLTSCDEGDKPGAPVWITGDSALTVENPLGDDYTVYFDGKYIGSVDSNSTRTWEVPSGAHSVQVDNEDRDTDDYRGSYYFEPARATLLEILEGPRLILL